MDHRARSSPLCGLVLFGAAWAGALGQTSGCIVDPARTVIDAGEERNGTPRVPVDDGGGPLDAGAAANAAEDAGATPDAGELRGTLGAGQLCGFVRERFPFSVPSGQAVEVTLVSPSGGDPDLAIYRATDENHVWLLGRASGADQLLVRGGGAFLAEVSSYNGACVDYRLTITERDVDPTTLTRISGRVSYEDRPHDENGFAASTPLAPARGVRVEIEGVMPTLSYATTTQPDGTYQLEVPLPSGAYRLRVVTAMEAFGQWATVRDRGTRPAQYAIPSTWFSAGDNVVLDIVASAADVGGAFHIADQTYAAYRLIAAHSDTLAPPLTVSWQRGQAFACGSCFAGDQISLGGQFEDPDEYDDDIILHEFGHYFARHYAPDASPGGAHRDRRVDPRLAYGEGLAYFFAALIQDDPILIDTYIDATRVTDLEAVTLDGVVLPDFYGTSNEALSGEMREEIPGALLWDAYDDDDAEAHDAVALGVDGAMRVLLSHLGGAPLDIGPTGIELADWAHGALCEGLVEPVDLQTLWEDRALPWPAEAGVAACQEKTRRDEPALRVIAERDPRGAPRLRVQGDPTLQALSWGPLTPQGIIASVQAGPVQRMNCVGGCVLAVPPDEAVWVQAFFEGRVVWRTVVPPAAVARFVGGPTVVDPQGKLGPTRLLATPTR